jgi:polyribonucleotide nucleotidyltransferase
MRNDVQVVVTVLSFDGENDPDTLAIIAASAALSISNIPWNGPVAAVRVGKHGDEFILNPVNGELAEGELDLLVSGTKDKINMIECAAKEVPEGEILKALEFGHEAIKKITQLILDVQKEIGKTKSEPALMKGTDEFESKVRELMVSEGIADALYDPDKKTVEKKTKAILEKVTEHIKSNYTENIDKLKEISELVFEEVSDEIVHKNVLENEKRPDGRKLEEIRQITCQVGILPRTHGTGLFTRGETQALTVTTLGAPGDEQIIDTMEVDMKKRYIHHYNFPPYSVGEVRPMRGPGRREIGHGALAEKALIPVLPAKEEFPYTILLVSEVLSSNGSSSMASTCGSTLSLMDAGVPIKRPVSGIAMGIIIDQKSKTNEQESINSDPKFKVLTDIQGLEDHYGDMDFKAAGTEIGITALQMDVKVDGVTIEMLKAVLEQSHGNRLEILEKIKATIAAPRADMSQYAPRIIIMHINPEKIRNVIGTGGKIINEIIDETGVEIDIEDDGSIFITSIDKTSAQKAQEWINNLTREVKPGEIFNAKITKIMNFGAFAEILPGQEGLIHISEIADRRINKVEDVLKVGDVIPVKVREIDSQGRINLSARLQRNTQ